MFNKKKSKFFNFKPLDAANVGHTFTIGPTCIGKTFLASELISKASQPAQKSPKK